MKPHSEKTSAKSSDGNRSQPPPVSQNLLDFAASGSYVDEPTELKDILTPETDFDPDDEEVPEVPPKK